MEREQKKKKVHSAYILQQRYPCDLGWCGQRSTLFGRFHQSPHTPNHKLVENQVQLCVVEVIICARRGVQDFPNTPKRAHFVQVDHVAQKRNIPTAIPDQTENKTKYHRE